MAPLPISDADYARHALGLINQGKIKPAERLLKDILRRSPDQPDALLGLGVLSGMRGDDATAVKHLRRATLKSPRNHDAHYNLGQALIRLGRHAEAIQTLTTASALGEVQHVHEKLGDCLRQIGDLSDAAKHYRRAVELAGHRVSGMLLSSLVETQRRQCDWNAIEPLEQRLVECAARGDPVEPLLLHYVTDDLKVAHRNAVAYAEHYLPTVVPPQAIAPGFSHAPRTRERIRVGYLSSDFRKHATSHLMAELFELHDRTRFETFALSFGPQEKGSMRERMEGAFDRFLDFSRLADLEIAKRIHALGIDILIDLNGYIANARPGILMARPAPIQCHYLAFPGTLGSPAIDYMLVDPVITPPDADAYYTEKLVRLPDCYQPNDRRRAVAEAVPTRASCGLPETGLVLASFNNPIKIAPATFAIWMRVLEARPDSVLWLFADSGATSENLRAAATAAGIDPGRLVFAGYVEPAQHLARLTHADLVLDCFPYGAHTTASDALWMGVPVLTQEGRSFASRVGASLLQAAGLPELITASPADYEREAIALTGAPERITALKAKLAHTRTTCRLFDTPRLVRHVESAYAEMWRRWQAHEPAAAFDVAKL